MTANIFLFYDQNTFSTYDYSFLKVLMYNYRLLYIINSFLLKKRILGWDERRCFFTGSIIIE